MKHHPEQKDNEIYMGNVRLNDRKFSYFEEKTSWKTNRYGNVAYTIFGTKLDCENYYPWFITIEEVQNQINQLKWEIKNIPCTWNGNKLETIAIYEQMIKDRTVFTH